MFSKEMLYQTDNNRAYSIIHGLMGFYKFGLDSHQRKKFESPLDFLNKLSILHPNKTFLMSPSNEKQLRNINL